MEFHVNVGKSLDIISDESIDFAFSFDSLVHADGEVIGTYLRQLARKLKPRGAGFIHHSNAGDYRSLIALTKTVSRILPYRAGKFVRRNLLIATAWRAEDMT